MTSIINQIEDYREILSNNLAYELENEEFKGHSKNGPKGVFTRDRKLTFKNLIVIIIIFKSSIQRELDRFFKVVKNDDFNIREVTKGALSQARAKLNPWAFIIVMTYGMTNDVKMGGMRNFKIDAFQTVLLDELIPYVDANFRTLSDQPHRAMAGLSMGGMETKTITLARPDVFSHYGLLSGGTYAPTDIKDKSKVKLIFMSCGSFENPDGVRKAADTLKEVGINAVSFVSENTRHEFQTWRRSLLELAPLLFKD